MQYKSYFIDEKIIFIICNKENIKKIKIKEIKLKFELIKKVKNQKEINEQKLLFINRQ